MRQPSDLTPLVLVSFPISSPRATLVVCAPLLVFAWIGIAEPALAQRLTLSEVLERAVSETEAAQILRARVQHAEAGERVAFADFLPRASATGTITRNDREIRLGDRVTTQQYDWSAGARAEVDLFRGAVLPTWRAAQHTTEALRERERWERATLRFAAARAFLEATAALETLEDAREAVTVARETREQIAALAEAGFRVEADVGQARLAELEAETEARAAERRLEDALTELAFLIGEPSVAAGALVRDDDAIEALLVRADTDRMRRSDLEAFSRDMEAADARVRARLWALAPSLNLAAQANFGRPSLRAPEGVWWALSLNASWQIFEWGRYAQIDQARLDRATLDWEFQAEERRITRDLTLAQRRLDETLDQLALTEEAVAVAEENQRIARVRFETGDVTALEVTVADNAVFRARNRATRVLLERDLARLALLYQQGGLE